MRGKLKALGLVAVAALAICAIAAPGASAAPAPAWSIHSLAVPTNFIAGDSAGEYFYEVFIQNTGGAATTGEELTLTDTLPAGLVVKDVTLPLREGGEMVDKADDQCQEDTVASVTTVTCTIPEALPGSEPALLEPTEEIRLIIHVEVPAGASGILTNFAEISGGGAPAALVKSENPVSEVAAPSGFQEFRSEILNDEGKEVTQAGSHPYQYSTSFAANSKATPAGSDAPFVPSGGDIKTIRVNLPPGLVGNPTAISECSPLAFNTSHNITPGPGSSFTANDCPDSSVVGVIVVQQIEGEGGILPLPLYNLEPPKGMPAQLGFQILGAPFYIDTSVRTGGDYGITASLRNVSEAKRVTASAVTIWGTPADEAHDELRGQCLNQIEKFPFSMGDCPAGIDPKPFFRLPTSCQGPLTTTMSFDTWTNPGAFVTAADVAPPTTGCELLEFEPTIDAVPQTSAADSPTGLSFNLHIPQSEEPDELATADLRDAVVTLPRGLAVNPSSANGLQGCSPAQIEINGPNPAQCPDASKIGTVEVITPLLDHPVNGHVFLATQSQNPFNSLLAIYIAAHDPDSGVVLKIAGRVETDPVTGQVTTRFTDNPQLPFEDLNVSFFDGPRAPLRTPSRCGDYQIATTLTPWSAPASGPPATPGDSFSVTGGPNGRPCPNGALDLRFSAGLTNPVAGAYSPFVMRLSREDATGEFASLTTEMPPGLTGKLKGIPYCPEAAIATATSRNAPGQGALERSQPSCPAASRVGSVIAGAGAGPDPFYTSGELYLAGPYKGAPLSFLATIPAIAGPFDLGVVATRIAVQVDPATARISAVSDPLPTILQGIPLDVRDIRVNIDRPNFTLAPTNCQQMTIGASVTGTEGQSASAQERFQVDGCKGLKFSPKLSLKLKGGTKRSQNPALRAVLTAKAGQANVGRAAVIMPPSVFIDQSHISNPCTRVQFNAGACPPKSILGNVVATSPLLDEPLRGPIYFRSNGGERELPDLVLDLGGQIHITSVGFIDSVETKGSEISRLRTTFAQIPDAPLSKVVLNLKGGNVGLIENSRNICGRPYRAGVKLAAHNGRRVKANPVIKVAGCKDKGKGGKGKKGR
jgi:uncharacterized repeat protein (TIGR01451 family)